MFSVQTSRAFVQLVVASLIIFAAMLSVRESVALTAPPVYHSTSHERSMLLAADDFTNGIKRPIVGTLKDAVSM